MPNDIPNQSSSKLTPDQIRQLSKTISEAQKLSNQQEEILSRILDGEINIGNLRISYLTQFFDIYSRKLDDVARKQSKLNDTFLVLDRKLTENYQRAGGNSNGSKTPDRPPGLSGGKVPDKPSSKPTRKPDNSDKPPPPPPEDDDDKKSAAKKASNLKRTRELEELERAESSITTEHYEAEMEKRYSIRSNLDRLVRDLQLNEDERANRALKNAKAREQELYSYRISMMSKLSSKEADLNKSLARLNALRSNDAIDQENRVLEYRLNKHQTLVDQQIDTQELYNELKAEQDFWTAGNMTETVDTTRYTTSNQQTTGDSGTTDDTTVGVGDVGANRGALEPVDLETDAGATIVPVDYDTEAQEDLVKYFSQELDPKIDQLITDLNILIENTSSLIGFEPGAEADAPAIPERLPVEPYTNIDTDTLAEVSYERALAPVSYEQAATPAILDTDTYAIADIQERQPVTQVAAPTQTTEERVTGIPNQATADVPQATPVAGAVVIAQTPEERVTDIPRQTAAETQQDTPVAPQQKQNDLKYNEAGLLAAQIKQEQLKDKYLRKLQKDRAEYIAKRELELALANDGVLSAEALTQIQREASERFDVESAVNADLIAAQEKAEAGKKLGEEIKKDLNTIKTGSFEERKEALKNLTHDSDGSFNSKKAATVALYAATNAISDLAKKLDATIDEIASKKGFIDTNLQGSKNETFAGSYWDQLVKDMTSVGAITPYFKQSDFAKNIESLVDKGIAFDLKQRAFLMTIKDKIATTFDASNGTLLRLIKIQQEDSTAGRLGMESALTAFLNEMYETSEYMHHAAGTVRDSLLEMQSLMTGKESTEVEFQVQKWLGSLSSVGMSDEAVNSIATAFGQIAAGQLEGITNGGASNLLIMAANEAGLPIADMLIDGINASDTNKLLQASVNYLAELAESAKDNRVVQQQLASVFGVKASDLRAATNLATNDTTSIYQNNKTYDQLLNRLFEMAGTMAARTSIAEMMTNIWSNGEYTLAGSMASTPISYLIYKAAKVVDDAAGGIDLPFLNVMGFGVDLNTTVSDLMRVAAVGTGLLGTIGPMVSGLSNSFNTDKMLETMGISRGTNLTTVARGTGVAAAVTSGGGASISESGYVGNASGSDIKDSTMQDAEDSKKQQMIEAKEEEEANQVDVLNTTAIKIYQLLEDVTTGKSSLTVRVNNYGLTKSSGGSSLGGVTALSENVSNDASLGGSSISTSGVGSGNSSSNSSNTAMGSGTSTNNTSVGNIDLGGWKLY